MLRRVIVLLVPLALMLSACSDGDDAPERSTTTTERDTSSSSTATSSTTAPPGRPGTTTSTAPTGPTRTLTGPGGTGRLSWTVVPNRSEFCYQISLDSRSAATGARLYRGAAGETGAVVLELVPPGQDGTVNTCSAGDQLLVEEVRAEPERFYVQVTTAKGTLRGQLA